MLHQLLDTSGLSAPEQDYLEILGNLIDEYESKAHPIESLPPHQMLGMSIESICVTQTEVFRAAGIPESRVRYFPTASGLFNPITLRNSRPTSRRNDSPDLSGRPKSHGSLAIMPCARPPPRWMSVKVEERHSSETHSIESMQSGESQKNVHQSPNGWR